MDSVAPLDRANTGTEPDPNDCSKETAHLAAVTQSQERVRAGRERAPATRGQLREALTPPEQQSADAAAESEGHVAAVRDRDEQVPCVARSAETETAECGVADDAPRYDHSDADAEAHLHVDATTA